MKKLLLLLLMALANVVVLHAQQAMVTLDKMNILYKDVPNPLSLLVTGYKVEDIKIEMENAVITRIDPQRFTCTPTKTGNCQLNIYAKNKKLATYIYRVRSMPAPIATLSGIEDEGALSLKEFISQLGLMSTIEGFEYDLRLPISNYRIRLFRDGRKLKDQSFGGGPIFNHLCKQMMNNIQVGDIVVFSDMKYVASDKQLHNSRNPYITVEIK